MFDQVEGGTAHHCMLVKCQSPVSPYVNCSVDLSDIRGECAAQAVQLAECAKVVNQLHKEWTCLLSIPIIVTRGYAMTYLHSHDHTFPFIVFCPQTVWLLIIYWVIVPLCVTFAISSCI